ncbi:MAG: thermonuclease family protein [Erythrobacter sp.]
MRRSARRTGRRTGIWQWWSWWRTPIFVLLLAGGWWLMQAHEPVGEWVQINQKFGVCGERGRPNACVSDGDTVTLGYGSNARRIRLTGFDTPEMEGACDAESATARVARTALRDWLNQGGFSWSGGKEPNYDKYGRELRSVRRALPDGSTQDLAEVMIKSGLAEGDGPWESRDWCD